jgi:hypothetical protein
MESQGHSPNHWKLRLKSPHLLAVDCNIQPGVANTH